MNIRYFLVVLLAGAFITFFDIKSVEAACNGGYFCFTYNQDGTCGPGSDPYQACTGGTAGQCTGGMCPICPAHGPGCYYYVGSGPTPTPGSGGGGCPATSDLWWNADHGITNPTVAVGQSFSLDWQCTNGWNSWINGVLLGAWVNNRPAFASGTETYSIGSPGTVTYTLECANVNVCPNAVSTFQVTAIPPNLPAPVNVQAVCLSSTQARFTWSAVTGAGDYFVRLNASPYGDWYNAAGGDTGGQTGGATSVVYNITADLDYQLDVQAWPTGDRSAFVYFRCNTPPPTPVPTVAPTLGCTLTASNPASGTAPLNGVDMTGQATGTATGLVRYQFDCTNDGTYEYDTLLPNNPFTIADLCNYPAAGTYTAALKLWRQGLPGVSVDCYTQVPVGAPPTAIPPTNTPIPPTNTPVPLSPQCTVNMSPKTATIGIGGTVTLLATVSNVQNGIVSSVNFSSDNGAIASVSPGSDALSPYTVVVTGQGGGITNVWGSCIMAGLARGWDNATITVNAPTPTPTIGPTSTPTPTLTPTPTPTTAPIPTPTPYATVLLSPGTITIYPGGPTETATAQVNVFNAAAINRLTFTITGPAGVNTAPPDYDFTGFPLTSNFSRTSQISAALAATYGPRFLTATAYLTSGSSVDSSTATVVVANPNGWFAGGGGGGITAAGGSLGTNIPAGSTPPYLIADGPGGLPGLPVGVGFSGNLASGNVNSQGWWANLTGNLTNMVSKKENRYPSMRERLLAQATPVNLASNSLDSTNIDGILSGAPAAAKINGVTILRWTGPGTLSISDGTGLDVTNRKVLVLADTDVNIIGNINLTNGPGFFALLSGGNVNVDDTVGQLSPYVNITTGAYTPHLEGIYYADLVFSVPTGGGPFGTDRQIRIDGTVVGMGGVNFHRNAVSAFPAEYVNFRPDLTTTLSTLGLRLKVTQELVAP